jgi:hypothetical protein
MTDPNPTEQWRSIRGAEGAYEVSNHGRVRSLDRFVKRGGKPMRRQGQPIRTPAKSNGYLHFKLAFGGRVTYPTVHQCVARAFLGPKPDGYAINHIDGDKANNRVSNLEYVTYAENAQHAVATGLAPSGEQSVRSKLTEHQVRAIRAARGHKTAKQLAKEYGVSHLYIPLIWTRKRWSALE